MKRFVWIPLLLLGCATTAPAPSPGSPDSPDSIWGTWNMVSRTQGGSVDAKLTLERAADGELSGRWVSRGTDMELAAIVVEGRAISFERTIPGGHKLQFAGTVEGSTIEGAWSGAFDDIPVTGTKVDAERDAGEHAPEVAELGHDRPILEKGGKTLLWANDEEWFDVTDSKIDPRTFNHGIGKDTIASVDEPEFVEVDDPRVEAAGITMDTPVLGVFLEGDARAYPVSLMDRHEIVNDEFGGEAYAVLW